jgi:ribonuclease HII
VGRLKRYIQKGRLEAGCDEAGRGCLAGPVYAAAVIIAPGTRLPGLNDSKKLSASARNALRLIIEERAMSWSVARVEPEEIDRVNILNASFLAMHRAVEKLHVRPEWLLIDGNRFNPYPGLDHTCVVKGDGKYAQIAAASILAKTHRDEYMLSLHEQFPDYDWATNKGYPTALHRQAISDHGPCMHHRNSFKLLPDPQLDMF